YVYLSIPFFFFFQAEDGIRDFHVTGVQTCALPISVLEYVDVAVEVLRADVVEHDVGATRGRGEFGDEVLLAVVHGDVGVELAAAFEPLVRARGDGDRRAEGLADLDEIGRASCRGRV